MGIFSWGYKKCIGQTGNEKKETEWGNTEKRTSSSNNYRGRYSEPVNYRLIDIDSFFVKIKRKDASAVRILVSIKQIELDCHK